MDFKVKKTNLNENTVQEIMQKIRVELKKENYRESKKINVESKTIYDYADFTQYSDIEFIKKSFRGILKREVDPKGLEYYLKQLRSQEQTKKEILTAIRYTPEGKIANVQLIGSKKEYIINSIGKVPILGTIMEWTLFIINFPKYIKEIYNNQIVIKQSVISNKEREKFEKFYIEFENKFRGDRVEIKEKLKVYLPYIKTAITTNDEILDIGCGRGEWIELLQENGYIRVKGVDINQFMLTTSKGYGLEVIESDAIEYLESLESDSLKAITGFHIIEHLPFNILMQLFEESYRVLQCDGMIIFETPNPENLLVGACNFYTDMTHINPLVPRTIEFLAKKSGFKNVEIKRLHPRKEPSTLENLELREVVDFINCGQDYAIIGYKL